MARRLLFLLSLFAFLFPASLPANATEIIPLEEIKPGLQGTARTIFAGRQVEQFDVEVLGVLKNFIGPRQDIILVRLLGEKLDYTGVVAGMSGSPVYIDGKLAGAIAFRFGAFAKEPIAGVTPIESMLKAARVDETPEERLARRRFPLPDESLQGAGLEAPEADPYLVPIETPLSFVGFHPEVIRRFSPRLARHGLLAVQGGGTAATDDTASLEPGGAVAAALVTGDMSVAGTCTVSHRVGDQLFACGHWLLSFGDVEMPMARAQIVATVPSEASSFKIANIGEVVGRFEQDRRSAIVGHVGARAAMLPVNLTLVRNGQATEYHYQIFQHPKISPQLLNLTLFNGIFHTIESGVELSYRLTGEVVLRDHTDLILDDMFSPTDSFAPDAFFVANSVGEMFQKVFTNPFEQPHIERIDLRVEIIPHRRAATIENAWADKSEVRPGETLRVKVVLQPYRGEQLVREVSVTVPLQAARGSLRVLVSDAGLLNRITRTMLFGQNFPGQRLPLGPRVTSLEQLISLLNRERRNDQLYVSLFQRTPTMLVQDKVLPSVPLSQMNVLNRQSAVGHPGDTLLFYESILEETSEPLDQVISGNQWLTLTVR